MKYFQWMLLCLISFAIAPLPGCTQPQNHKAQAPAPTSEQAVLRISVLPTQNRTEQEKIIMPLDAHLEKVLGQRVDFLIAKDYKDNVGMLLDGRANAAYTGAVSYLEALEQGAKVEAIAAPIDKFTNRPWYRACMIVAANSPIKTLQDLKGKRVAFVDPSSTSGYLLPLLALRQAGIDPVQDFSQVIFGGTHAKTEALLEDGKVDAIATNIPSYTKRQTLGKLTPQNSRVFWKSQPVPHSPFLIASDLPADVKNKFKEAFLTIPSGLEDIVGAQIKGYTLVVSNDYEPMQQVRIQLGLAKMGQK